MKIGAVEFVTHDKRHVHVNRENFLIEAHWPLCDNREPEKCQLSEAELPEYDAAQLCKLADMIARRCDSVDYEKSSWQSYFHVLKFMSDNKL